MTIRDADSRDAERIAEIYRYYAEETAISFETEAPDADEMGRRIAEVQEGYPYLVILEDGRIEGYAYVHRFSERAAYHRSAEITMLEHTSTKVIDRPMPTAPDRRSPKLIHTRRTKSMA